jgi:hypothetical protein
MGFESKPLRTRSVSLKKYGLLQVMGYEGYGLRGVRLYLFSVVSSIIEP